MVANSFLNIILFFSISLYSQQEIYLEFNPKINEQYEYVTQFYGKEGYNEMTSKTTSHLTFFKEGSGYKVLREYTKAEFTKDNELIFFLNMQIDSTENYPLHVLKSLLTQKNNYSYFDLNGSLKKVKTNFLDKHKYLRPSRKAFLNELINNLNINISNFFTNKTFKTNETFYIDNGDSTFFNQASKLKGKLIAIIENKAIFSLNTEFYTAIRNREREITGKKINKIDVILVINKDDGMPLNMKMIFENDNVSQLITQYAKGETNIELKNYYGINNASIEDVNRSVDVPKYYIKPNKDSIKLEYEKNIFASKVQANVSLAEINPFRADASRRCVSMTIDIASSKKNTLIKIKNIRAFDTNNNLIISSVIDTDFTLFNYKESIRYPLGNEWCELPISYFEIDTELSANYGTPETVSITNENALNNGIITMKDNELEIEPFLSYYIFYDEEKNEVPIKRMTINSFSSNFKNEIPYLKNKLSPKDIFLFAGLLGKQNNQSLQVFFDREISAIEKYIVENEVKLSRTIKVPVNR